MAHDDFIRWKHFPRYWPFVRGIHRSPVNSLHKGQWRGALMFSLICIWINGWVNNRKAGDLRRNHAHYDVIVMMCQIVTWLDNLFSSNSNRCFTSFSYGLMNGIWYGYWVSSSAMDVFNIKMLAGFDRIRAMIMWFIVLCYCRYLSMP